MTKSGYAGNTLTFDSIYTSKIICQLYFIKTLAFFQYLSILLLVYKLCDFNLGCFIFFEAIVDLFIKSFFLRHAPYFSRIIENFCQFIIFFRKNLTILFSPNTFLFDPKLLVQKKAINSLHLKKIML